MTLKYLCAPTNLGTTVDDRDTVPFGSQTQCSCNAAKPRTNDKSLH